MVDIVSKVTKNVLGLLNTWAAHRDVIKSVSLFLFLWHLVINIHSKIVWVFQLTLSLPWEMLHFCKMATVNPYTNFNNYTN